LHDTAIDDRFHVTKSVHVSERRFWVPIKENMFLYFMLICRSHFLEMW